MTLHGVGLSIGSVDEIDWHYLKKVKQLAHRIESFWISDHLSWNRFNKRYSNDLLPLPFNQETLNHVVARIQAVQDFLKQPIMLENISSYLTFNCSDMTEWQFLNAVCQKSGCYLLLDINNIFVSCSNFELDPNTYLTNIDKKIVKQLHLAGFNQQHDHLLDMHCASVHAAVWHLFQQSIDYFGAVPTAIEWDIDIPSFDVLMNEVRKAQGFFV